MASIASLGIGSGIDLNGLLDQLESAERQRLTPIVQQQKSYQSKISAYGKLESALSKLQEAAEKLDKADTFRAVTSSVTGEGVTAAAGSDAVPGSYKVDVTSLAKAQSLASAGIADKTISQGNGADTITITQQNGNSYEVAIGADSSLEDIRDAINGTEGIGVTASIINDGNATNPYRLVLTAKETGTDSQVTSITANDAILTDRFSFNDPDVADPAKAMQQNVAAENAALTINGISVVSQSNRVEEAIQGVTLELSSEPANVTVDVSQDSETITGDVQAFVDAYNTLQGTLDSLTAYDAGSDTAGLLLGDSMTRGIENRLRGVMSDGLDQGSLKVLSDIGIELQLDGKLKVDSEKLKEIVSGNPEGLSQFFGGDETVDGFSDKLMSTLGPMLKDDGTLDNATSGLKDRISSLGQRYEREESSIAATIERYRTQFAQMDSLVSQMNSTMSYLSQQFQAMNAQLSAK